MPRRRHKLDAEAAEVPANCSQHVGVGLTGAATAGTYLTQAQRTPKNFAKFLVECGGEANLFVAGFSQHKVFATARGHAMVTGLSDGMLRADLHTGSTKDAATEIERDRFASCARNGLGRTHRHADVAAVGALAPIHFECSAVAVRQGSCRAFGISHRFATAFQTMGNGINDKHSFGAAS